MPLSDLIGQPGLTRLLARLIARDRLPHALLLEGIPGCGRRTLARSIAQALLCAESRAGDACGICPSCQLVRDDTHPDLVSLSHDSESDDLSAETVREKIAEAAHQSPLLGHHRVFILPSIERLHVSAANSLLKILEEPPPGTYLLMTTAQAGGLLRTIRSRSQLYRLLPLTVSDLEQILVRGGMAPSLARDRAAFGAGSHRGLWREQSDPPLATMLHLCHSGYRCEWVAELLQALPQRVDDDVGRTLAAEQRRVMGQWLQALLQALRSELSGSDGSRTADLIERILHLHGDLSRNLSPQIVIEGLALATRLG